MSSSTIEERKETLRQIKDLRKEERKPFIEKCSSECIHTICEACYNFLNGGIKLKKFKSIKDKIRPHRFDIRKLANPRISVKSKRKILSEPQQGGGIFSMLATSLIPAIIESFV